MDTNQAAIVIQRFLGPLLLALCSIGLIAITIGGIRAIGTSEQLNSKEWIFGLSFMCSGIALGVYICRKEFGWFKRQG